MKRTILLLVLLITCTLACKKDTTPTQSNSLAVLATGSISGITASTAVSGGNITADGGSPITARGVVWGTSSNPTVNLTTKTTDGTGTGTFTSTLTGLLPNTTYYVRAYATNSAGTAYGNEVSFSTAKPVASAFYYRLLGSELEKRNFETDERIFIKSTGFGINASSNLKIDELGNAFVSADGFGVKAFNPNGEPLWSFDLSSQQAGNRYPQIKVYKDYLFIKTIVGGASITSTEGTGYLIFKLDKLSGTLIWKKSIQVSTGAEKSTASYAPFDITNDIIIMNGVKHQVLMNPRRDGSIITSLSAIDGAELWTKTFYASGSNGGQAPGGLYCKNGYAYWSTVAEFDADNRYIAGHKIYKIDVANGNIAWVSSRINQLNSFSNRPPFVVNGKVVASVGYGLATFDDVNGSIIWTKLFTSNYNSPIAFDELNNAVISIMPGTNAKWVSYDLTDGSQRWQSEDGKIYTYNAGTCYGGKFIYSATSASLGLTAVGHVLNTNTGGTLMPTYGLGSISPGYPYILQGNTVIEPVGEN